MNTQLDPEIDAQQPNVNSFVHLLFGLHSYLQNEMVIPNSLRRALAALTFEQGNRFPKTLYQFIVLCHQPVSDWYPLPIPNDFNRSQAILYDRCLSDEAQDYYLTLTEQMELPPLAQEDIPQAALDNWIMIELRQRLKDSPDASAAQDLYMRVRSFLIEHSWTTPDRLRAQTPAVFQELRQFYDYMPSLPVDELLVCDRCGLLEWRNGRWQGIKPSFCSDHGSGSPHVHTIPNTRGLFRLREGTHLRTFLPGRLELALFTFAESMRDQYPDQVPSVERYPGLDTYDLRLNFVDESWAVDAKDQTNPARLASQIHAFYNEGDLSHLHAFYVIPDARMEDVNYREQLERRTAGVVSAHLHIVSVSEFQQHIEEKLKTLINPPRQKKGKKD